MKQVQQVMVFHCAASDASDKPGSCLQLKLTGHATAVLPNDSTLQRMSTYPIALWYSQSCNVTMGRIMLTMSSQRGSLQRMKI